MSDVARSYSLRLLVLGRPGKEAKYIPYCYLHREMLLEWSGVLATEGMSTGLATKEWYVLIIAVTGCIYICMLCRCGSAAPIPTLHAV